MTKQELLRKTDYWDRAAKRMVVQIQERLLNIPIEGTELIFEVSVTRWGENEFELDMFSGNVMKGPERAAEIIALRWSAN